jgi:putative flippase GtrA
MQARLAHLGRQGGRFTIVGAAATALHFGVAVGLLMLRAQPLTANGLGFAAATWLSFVGHERWTFAMASSAGRDQRFRRFFGLALGGLLLNETTYFVLLRHAGMSSVPAIALALASSAALTFVASRSWVFRAAGGV